MLRKRIASRPFADGRYVGRCGGRGTTAPGQRWMLKDAVLAVEVIHPKPLVELASSEKTANAVTSFPGYRSPRCAKGSREFLGMVKYVETMLGADWRTAVQ